MKKKLKVICRGSYGYNLTVGATYDVVELIGLLMTRNFTFPRYVTVIDDDGRRASAHATRFELENGLYKD